MANMITMDGSFGEGGGQILRTSLALSLVTGQPFCMENIRAKRDKPGLLRQHLTAVNAAAEVSQAQVDGNAIGSMKLSFSPKVVKAGSYRWAVGTAGSATLVLQTVLPGLLTADTATELVLEGGTHNPYAPPFDFLEKAFLPIVNRMGPRVTAKLERPGFYPAGGGRFTVSIQPAKKLARVDLMDRGDMLRHEGVGVVSQLPRKIAEAELAVLQAKLSWGAECFRVEEVANPRGPGNILICTVESRNITEVFTGFGERGVPADRVALATIEEVREYLSAGVPVGRHLADQLMIPMALAGGGKFRTLPPTRHALTNIEVLKKFLDVEITVTKIERPVWEIEIVEGKR
jgi:RNA 3'-terminal phosphate cyclase (ATP)